MSYLSQMSERIVQQPKKWTQCTGLWEEIYFCLPCSIKFFDNMTAKDDTSDSK
jgi:hypothetical protein